MSTPDDRRWHALSAEAVFAALGSGPDGLSEAEARRRQTATGANRLPPTGRVGPLRRFLRQFHNVLIYVLLASAAVTTLLGQALDAAVILGVVVINAVIGFFQEGKAERALEAIRHLLSPQAAVRRDGRLLTLPAEALVPGDVVWLAPGDRVPADLRLFQVKDLRIDEAVLTGESLPVEKSTAPVAAGAEIADRSCLAYSGTLVTSGQGAGVVVAIGAATEIGRISRLLGQVEGLTTPLLMQMDRFGRRLSAVIVAIAALTFAFGTLVRGYSASEMFLAAVGLAVAAIPEGLPAIMTITLAIGVQRMARRHAIIRRLPAVETLGAVTVICTDKTGTLTRNEMTVRTVLTATRELVVSGVGYDPHGSFRVEGQECAPAGLPELLELARAGLLCNDAVLRREDGQWRLQGDPTEGALITLAMKAGLDPAFEAEAAPRDDVIPFDAAHRCMATLHHDHAGHGFVYLKGAPERVLELCAWQRQDGVDRPLDAQAWAPRLEALAARGQRLLALAFGTVAPGQRALHCADLEAGLTLLGVVGLADPPRAEAIRAVAQCRAAGIRVKMITGDHASTALAIAWDVGIDTRAGVLSGHDLDGLEEAALQARAAEVDVFARASPEHKLRLVEALQANGEVVAMTGDGVNDAPALKRADVGVAMGLKGTEVAKEAAEMVLADDNFASIAHAVEEGRAVYDNLRKAILFILPTNAGEALIILAAVALGLALPITPLQILWINMVTAVTLALALAFEPPERDLMQRAPRARDEPLLSRFLVWRIGFVSWILVAGTFGLYLWETERGATVEHARTVALNALVMFEVFYLFNTRYLQASVLNREGLFGNRYALMAIAVLLGLQLALTYLPALQALFGTVALTPGEWLQIVLVAVSVLFAVELEKAWLRRWSLRKQARLE